MNIITRNQTPLFIQTKATSNVPVRENSVNTSISSQNISSIIILKYQEEIKKLNNLFSKSNIPPTQFSVILEKMVHAQEEYKIDYRSIDLNSKIIAIKQTELNILDQMLKVDQEQLNKVNPFLYIKIVLQMGCNLQELFKREYSIDCIQHHAHMWDPHRNKRSLSEQIKVYQSQIRSLYKTAEKNLDIKKVKILEAYSRLQLNEIHFLSYREEGNQFRYDTVLHFQESSWLRFLANDPIVDIPKLESYARIRHAEILLRAPEYMTWQFSSWVGNAFSGSKADQAMKVLDKAEKQLTSLSFLGVQEYLSWIAFLKIGCLQIMSKSKEADVLGQKLLGTINNFSTKLETDFIRPKLLGILQNPNGKAFQEALNYDRLNDLPSTEIVYPFFDGTSHVNGTSPGLQTIEPKSVPEKTIIDETPLAIPDFPINDSSDKLKTIAPKSVPEKTIIDETPLANPDFSIYEALQKALME